MQRISVALVFLGLLGGLAHAEGASNRSRDTAYIRQAESDWAESVVAQDVAVLERILAADFVGVDIDGSHYTKADAIKQFKTQRLEFLSNHLNDVQIRFFGNVAVAQGNESWRKKDGSVGSFVWTDTWVSQHGKWQIVAAEDLVPPPKP